MNIKLIQFTLFLVAGPLKFFHHCMFMPVLTCFKPLYVIMHLKVWLYLFSWFLSHCMSTDLFPLTFTSVLSSPLFAECHKCLIQASYVQQQLVSIHAVAFSSRLSLSTFRSCHSLLVLVEAACFPDAAFIISVCANSSIPIDFTVLTKLFYSIPFHKSLAKILCYVLFCYSFQVCHSIMS